MDAFNARMTRVLNPGLYLTIDKCMSMWKGMCEKIAGIYSLPHKMKIARKSEGMGAEFKTIADAETGCIPAADIMEGLDG
jgi:hypothetical protein